MVVAGMNGVKLLPRNQNIVQPVGTISPNLTMTNSPFRLLNETAGSLQIALNVL
jgi:hypothetical protein